MGGPSPAVTAIVRDVRCKDCLRERLLGWADPDGPQAEADEHFEYNEAWAQQALDRGGSRTDRCPRHRRLHKQEISGLAVAYIDLQTIGEVADRQNPMGPLGGLGPLPDLHKPVPKAADIPFAKFGMTDDQVREIYRRMSNPDKRVLILRAGTGTGKSTFFPFRLLCPPEGVDFSFTARGPIVVTEPRVQATVGVARYVGERLVMGCPLMECSVHGSFNPKSHVDDANAPTGSICTELQHCGREHVGDHPGPKAAECRVADCARHIGPGYPVGYQVKGDARHDAATQLVYVTDGTMINWLREGRLNKVGTVVVDEAHERSSNIDFIMGYIRREIDRYPHLRVIVTSATFDVAFYEDYFGGPGRVETMDVPADKDFGYGAPLFPITSGIIECGCEADEHGRLPHEPTSDLEVWLQIEEHWPAARRYGPEPDDGSPPEDLWAITKQLHDLRFTSPLSEKQWTRQISPRTQKQLGQDLADYVVKLVASLEQRGIYGDVLAFLPNARLIDHAVGWISARADLERADVFALIQSAPTEQKEAALESRPRGAKRKIVVSTNLAETSLTVSGVRFVVDSALTTQGAWDPTLASKSVPTTLHSQAGVRQRWGRVGRDAPGWVFPLYTRSQFDKLARDTPPGSTRDNLEQLVMKAKSAGIDDVAGFRWPAAHKFGELDESAVNAMDVFVRELARADAALVTSGVVDDQGHLTSFGRELERFGQHSAGFAVATILADQLACVPEMVTALNLLEGQKPQGFEKVDLGNLALFDRAWPKEWRELAAHRWQQLHIGCRDDLDVALRVVSLWERADPARRPWEPSPEREAWARSWWLNHAVLLQLAEVRRNDLEGLSAAMKEEVKRFLDPRLAPRVRAVITRAFGNMRYQRNSSRRFVSAGQPEDPPADISERCRLVTRPPDVIALTRGTNGLSGKPELRNVVVVTPWAVDPSIDAIDLVVLCAEHCHPGSLTPGDYDTSYQTLLEYPIGAHVELAFDAESGLPSAATVYPPFGAPAPEPVGEDAEGPDDDAAEEDGALAESEETADDAVGWPVGFLQPIEDEERNERLRLEEPDNDERDLTTGRALGLEVNDEEIAPTAHVVDLLARANRGPRANLIVGGAPVETGGWYRCSEYKTAADGVAVVLEPLPPERIQVTDPRVNPTYSLFERGMLVMGVVDEVSDRGVRVRFRDDVTGFCVRARLPRETYNRGEPVVMRVHEVDTDAQRLILDPNPYVVTAEAPEHWRAALRHRIAELELKCEANLRVRDLRLTSSRPDAEAAAALQNRLVWVLGSPAAAIEIRAERHGAVQGTRGARLIDARERTGALVCDFAEGTHTLLVSAETNDALVRCLDILLGPVRAFTGTMKVPAGRTGTLIGSGGETVNELKRASGCSNARGGDNDTWTLNGRTRESIDAFVRLADEKVSGCALTGVRIVEPAVRDIFGDVVPEDWRAHTFARGNVAVATTGAGEHVTDLRPPAASTAATADVGEAPSQVGSGRVVRFAKVSATCALIVEVDPENHTFDEFDPLAPDDRWNGEIAVLDDGSIRFTVASYELTVRQTSPAVLEGVETGPDGDQGFSLIHLSRDVSHLDWRDDARWVAFALQSQSQQRWTRGGAALISVDHAEDESIFAEGLYDARSWRATRNVSSSQPHDNAGTLRLDVDGWVEDQPTMSIPLVSDPVSLCYRSADFVIYPLASGDATAELRGKRKRRRRRRNHPFETDPLNGEVSETSPDDAGVNASNARATYHSEPSPIAIVSTTNSDGGVGQISANFARLAVACSSMSSGHLEVFAADAQGVLRHRWFWPEEGWSDWYEMDVPEGRVVVSVAAGSLDDRHQEVFIAGADGSIYHRWNWLSDAEGGSTWSDWDGFGG
jgi:HrpA-like RNA helicase